ncbi:MAG: PQQ-binding-like beta-propeller repeat protein [Polyangiaceae bacterium]
MRRASSTTPSLSGLAFLAGLLCACGADQAHSDAQPSANPSSRTTTTSASATSSASAESHVDAQHDPWQWRGPALGKRQYGEPVATADGTCRFVYSDDKRTSRTECFAAAPTDATARRRWGWDEAGAFATSAALAVKGDTLFVARFSNIASGCVVYAYSRDRGDLLWRKPLTGLGPVDHSQYLNDVEVSVEEGGLVVRGWEIGGRYVEVLSPASGETLSLTRIGDKGEATAVPIAKSAPVAVAHPGAAESIKWSFPAPPAKGKPKREVRVTNREGLSCALDTEGDGNPFRFDCSDAKKNRLYGFELTNQPMPGRTLAMDESRVYVGRYSAVTSGASVLALDVKTGQVLWQAKLYGLGGAPQAADVQNHIHLEPQFGKDLVTVFGQETSGNSASKYVEVLDALTGAVRGNRLE